MLINALFGKESIHEFGNWLRLLRINNFFFGNITIEFMFAGINMFWARLRLLLARAATINITFEGIEEIKTEKNDNKTLRRIFFSPAL